MKKNTKTWLVIAVSLVVIGGMIFGGVMTLLKWDFTKLSTVKYETNEYEISENYTNIKLVTDTADITFLPANGEKSSVVCHEQKKLKHTVAVEEDVLVIELHDTRKWYEYIGINFGTPKITVYIPQGEYGTLSIQSSTGDVEIPKDFKFENMDISLSTGDVTNHASAVNTIKIQTNTGHIRVADISVGMLDLSVSTGKTNITNVQCKNVLSSGNTGDLRMENVVATEKFSVERSTGDVKFDGCDAAEIFIQTDTGNVMGSLLSDKVFITQTDTGRVDVPKTVSGGRCEIFTDTGDIKITVAGIEKL